MTPCPPTAGCVPLADRTGSASISIAGGPGCGRIATAREGSRVAARAQEASRPRIVPLTSARTGSHAGDGAASLLPGSEGWQPQDTAPQVPVLTRLHADPRGPRGATPRGSHTISVRKTLGITRGPCSTLPGSDMVTAAHSSLVPRPHPLQRNQGQQESGGCLGSS